MKIVKHYDKDPVSENVMKIFDKALFSFFYNWPLERMDIYITDSERGEAWLEGDAAKIFIGRENAFVREMDEKGIEALLLLKIFEIIMKIRGFDISKIREKYHCEGHDFFEALLLLEEFVAGRKVAKKFPDLLFYKNIEEIRRTGAESYVNWLKRSLCSLMFYRIDKWNMEFMENISKNRDKVIRDDACIEKIKDLIDKNRDNFTLHDMESIMETMRPNLCQESAVSI